MSTRQSKSVRSVRRNDLGRASIRAIGIRSSGAAFGFLFNVLIARSLGKEGTGVVLFYLSFASMIGLIATAGMDVVGLRELSRQEDSEAAVRVVGRVLCNGLFSALVFSLAAFWYLMLFHITPAGISATMLCAVSVLILVLSALQKSLSDWLIALHEYSASQLAFYFLNRVGSLLLLGLVAVVVGPAVRSIPTFVLIYGAGLLLAVVFAFGRVLRHFALQRILANLTPSAEFLRDGIACGVQNAAFIALSLSPFVLLGAVSSASELALFGVSQRLVALVVLVLTTISQIAMKELASAWGREDSDALAAALTASVRLTIVMAIGMTVPLVVFAPVLLAIFGKSFAAAASTLLLLSAGVCAQGLGMPFQSALLATNHERTARNVTLACAAVGIMLNALMISRWGAPGAALGTGLGLTLQSLGHGALALRVLPVRVAFGRVCVVSKRQCAKLCDA